MHHTSDADVWSAKRRQQSDELASMQTFEKSYRMWQQKTEPFKIEYIACKLKRWDISMVFELHSMRCTRPVIHSISCTMVSMNEVRFFFDAHIKREEKKNIYAGKKTRVKDAHVEPDHMTHTVRISRMIGNIRNLIGTIYVRLSDLNFFIPLNPFPFILCVVDNEFVSIQLNRYVWELSWVVIRFQNIENKTDSPATRFQFCQFSNLAIWKERFDTRGITHTLALSLALTWDIYSSSLSLETHLGWENLSLMSQMNWMCLFWWILSGLLRRVWVCLRRKLSRFYG